MGVPPICPEVGRYIVFWHGRKDALLAPTARLCGSVAFSFSLASRERAEGDIAFLCEQLVHDFAAIDGHLGRSELCRVGGACWCFFIPFQERVYRTEVQAVYFHESEGQKERIVDSKKN